MSTENSGLVNLTVNQFLRRGMDRRSFIRAVGATAGVAALTGLLAACGDDEDDEAPEPGAEETPDAVDDEDADEDEDVEDETDDEEPDETSSQGTGIAIEGTIVTLPSIDPAVGADFAESRTIKQLYDALYRHDGSPPELVPWLATDHEMSDDATVWTFTIDERAHFQDGSPLTADAVVYSAQRLLRVQRGVSWMFSAILPEDGIEAVDEQTVTFTLSQPFAPFLDVITWLLIVNPAIVDEHEEDGDMGQGWLSRNSAGSGPFKIRRWEEDELYEFEADPNYWRGWDGPHLDGYIHQVIRESSTKRLNLADGSIHGAEWLALEDIELLDREPDVIVPDNDTFYVFNLWLNTQRGPTSDVHVRRAISYAFDYDAMIETVGGTARAERSPGPVPPAMRGFAEDLPYYTTDLDLAREELAQSEEWSEGFALEYHHTAGIEEQRITGLILADQLSELNITVDIIAVPWSQAVELRANPETSPYIYPLYSAAAYPDPDNFLFSGYHSSRAGLTFVKYSNEELDALLEDARGETDPDARMAMYHRAQEILVEDAAVVWVFAQRSHGLVHRTELQGFEYTPVTGNWWQWHQMYLEE